ncbi:MAG: hypothetical protein DRJ26_04350 [Candidatus Methanomethylicota archaeon]|uniref:TIGR00267 family protein n=1 Tax=Thermoproteota archaeon TaxID=2056631 RepID=A0A497F084_9CREN|nr:MAG: hypothetical protein DRJ26_04350 [Candidatus Verstraetearchaeota archaeon]
MGGEEESDSLSFLEALEEKADNLRYYIKLSGVSEIARRYFVMNAFDGAVTMLGVLIGAIIGGGLSPKIILATGLGAGIAMGVSGFFGAYLAEEAERTRRIKQLERALHIDLDDSVIERAARVAAIMAAFIDALSPVMATIVTLIPIILAVFGIIEAWTAIITSIATILVLLTILGLFLGKISGERILYYSIATTCAGLVTGLLGLLLHVLFSL